MSGCPTGDGFRSTANGEGNSGFSLLGRGLGNVENTLDLRGNATDTNTDFLSRNLATGSEGSGTRNRFFLTGPGF